MGTADDSKAECALLFGLDHGGGLAAGCGLRSLCWPAPDATEFFSVCEYEIHVLGRSQLLYDCEVKVQWPTLSNASI